MEGMKEEQPGTDRRKEVTEFHEDRQEFQSEMNSHFEALHRLIIRGAAGLFATLVIGFLSLAVTQG
ncbi:MAG TPA: hypothetical protein VFT79_00210 [Solirubrobacterales bacterium]|nr:hypothetical protein [Solirubrobacterales bacterium]